MRLHEVKRARADKRMEINEAKALLRNKRAELRTKAEELPVDQVLPAEDVTAMDALQAKVDALEAEADSLDARVTLLEQLQADDATSAQEPDQVVNPGADVAASFVAGLQKMFGHNQGPRMTPHGLGEPARHDKAGYSVARMMIGKAWVKMGMTYPAAAAEIERRFGDKGVAKALNTAGVATGGALIPQNYFAEIIDLLRAEAVVRKMQPEFRDMPSGNMTQPRLMSAATASYGGELDAIPVSQQSFDAIQLNAKKLGAVVPVTNDLIRRTPANVEQIITGDLVRTTALVEDLAFLMADGSLGTPIGLYNQCLASRRLIVAPFGGTDNASIATSVIGTINTMKLFLKQGMSRMVRPAWFMNAVTEGFLLTVRDQVGGFLYRDEVLKGTLEGVPFATTQQLPTNINTGTTQSPTNNGAFLILVDMADVIVADTLNYQLDISDQATYVVGGQAVSAFQMDQTLFRVIQEHDIALKHQGSLVMAVLPGWAPAGFTNFSSGVSYYVQAPTGDQSAAPSTWGTAAPTGSNNPGNIAANVAGGQMPGRP